MSYFYPSFRTSSHWSVAGLIVGLSLGLSGCSTSKEVLTKPVVVEREKKRPEKPEPLELSDQAVFRAAGAAFRDKDYERSASFIENLSSETLRAVMRMSAGSMEVFPWSAFNATAKRFLTTRQSRSETAGSKDAHDALFRAATCMQAAEKWTEAIEYWSRVLRPEYSQISDHDQMEGHVRRAWAREKTGDMARAERDYKVVFKIHRENLDNRLIRTTPLVALAHQRVGYLYGSLVDSIKIRLPVERMARDIEEKASYFLKAQSHLLDAIRRHHRSILSLQDIGSEPYLRPSTWT